MMQDDFGEEIQPYRRKSDQQIQILAARLSKVESDLATNTKATQRIEMNTADIVVAFQALQGGLKVLEWLGKAGKPFMWLGAVLIASFNWQTVKASASSFFVSIFR